MKTIKIEIKISDNNNTLISDINEQIKYHLEQKRIADNQIKDLELLIQKTKEEVKRELNSFIGYDVWFDYYGNTRLGLSRSLEKKYPNFWISFTYKSDTVRYGNIKYQVPNLEKGIEIQLDSDYSKNTIEDLSEVHEICTNVYIDYLTALATQN